MKKVFTLLEKKFWASLICLVFFQVVVIGQSLSHPHIWVKESDKQEILDNIGKYDWASVYFTQLKGRIDGKKSTHITNPSAVLNLIQPFPGSRSGHNDMLTSASEAAILYYLTDDATYAQYAADILSHYTDRLSLFDSIRYSSSSTGLFYSDWWIESRTVFPKIAIIYDFIYNFVNSPSTTVYDNSISSRKSFDNTAAQTTVKKLAAVVFKSIGATNCNWSVLAGNGALFNILMIDDDATRESFFSRFFYYPNNEKFDAYEWTLANFTSQNIWDEPFGYAKGSHSLVLQSMNVIDRYKPELDIINKNLRILDGYSFYENYFYPSGSNLKFGDTGTDGDMLDGYQRIVKIADRKNMTEYLTKYKKVVKYEYDKVGGHPSKAETQSLEWGNPLELLWGIHIEDTITGTPPKIETSLPLEFAGIVLQRNFNTTDIKNNGMMYYSGGASYVHAHSSGIHLELYGLGYVLGTESGSGTYGSAEHEGYRIRHASHNTVIANSSGKRGNTWGTVMSKVNVVAYEPRRDEEPVSAKFSFSIQYIDDTFNNCKQQRTNSIIRTSNNTAYYFDIFRSKGNVTNNHHDYIYHNIGDGVSLKYTDNTDIPLSTSTKYSSDITNSVTGWKFFETVKSSNATNKAVNATFSLNTVNRAMNVYMPSGIDREYATAVAPYTKGAEGGYESAKTPVMTIRQSGEAWNKAFVAVFEPGMNAESTVQSVENIELDGKVIGAVVVSMVGGKEIKDYIISLDQEDSVYIPEHFMWFKGRFGIVRKEEQSAELEQITLYIGSGESIGYADLKLVGDDEKKNVETFFGIQKLTPDTRFTVATQVLGGGGTLSKSPDQADYAAGAQVVVIANPEPGYVLDAWLGDADGNENTDTLTLFSNKNVLARFRQGEYYTLSLTSENGEVTKSELGNEFIEQSCIELTAVPNDGFVFDSWSGDVSSTDNPLTICFDSNKNITANFNLNTSISETLSNSIIVSPNPSYGIFEVQVSLANTWSVYDISGKFVESGNSDGSFELDLTSFKKSMFILSIRTNNSIAVKRIFVK